MTASPTSAAVSDNSLLSSFSFPLGTVFHLFPLSASLNQNYWSPFWWLCCWKNPSSFITWIKSILSSSRKFKMGGSLLLNDKIWGAELMAAPHSMCQGNSTTHPVMGEKCLLSERSNLEIPPSLAMRWWACRQLPPAGGWASPGTDARAAKTSFPCSGLKQAVLSWAALGGVGLV